MTRQEKLTNLCEIRDEIKLMRAEIFAADCEIRRTTKHIDIAENAFYRLADEIRLDDLVHFCNTGRYPE